MTPPLRPWPFVQLLAAVLAPVVMGCEEAPRVVLPVDAGASPSSTPPVREGCVRTGTLEAIETDPSCVVKRVNDDVMRAAMKSLSISLTAEPTEVASGGTALLNVTIKNISAAEITLFFEVRPRPSGPRTDWSRVVGIPEPHPAASEIPRLLFPMTTTDSYERDVDAVPTVAGTNAPSPSAVLAVHLRPGGKLTHVMSWWALRIPAPAPVVKDDAGHRYVPKTTAILLFPGEYTITVELPLYGLGREERKVTARMRVTRVPLPDGGLRRSTF